MAVYACKPDWGIETDGRVPRVLWPAILAEDELQIQGETFLRVRLLETPL